MTTPVDMATWLGKILQGPPQGEELQASNGY